MNLISMDKKYKTRGGQNVRILCVDRAHHEFPVMALITTSEGFEQYTAFTSTGSFHGNGRTHSSDLVEQSEEHSIDVWIVVYENKQSGYKDKSAFFREQDAKDYAYHRGFDIKAIKKFTLTVKEGEGL